MPHGLGWENAFNERWGFRGMKGMEPEGGKAGLEAALDGDRISDELLGLVGNRPDSACGM